MKTLLYVAMILLFTGFMAWMTGNTAWANCLWLILLAEIVGINERD